MPHNRNARYLPGVRHLPLTQTMELGARVSQDHVARCCVPSGCPMFNDAPIYAADPGDSVRVVCNNEACEEGQWMHGDCFGQWQEHVLAYLRSCGRARSWSEKQRLQNLWTKKGYDLAFKVCDCKCGRGHLRKDLNYMPQPKACDEKKRRRHKSKPQSASPPLERGASVGSNNTNSLGMTIQAVKQQQQQLLHHMIPSHPQLRVRTASFSSTGSTSPPSSAGTPPLTPGGSAAVTKKTRFDFFADTEQAAAGNIFRRRTDYSVFSVLPRHQQNPYHIKMEDEGPHGNDETRCFVLTNLSSHQVTEVSCVVCCTGLTIYDKYPLIDGSFFLSPQRYNTDLQVLQDGRMLYLNAVCMKCLELPRLRCLACRKPWHGSAFMIGSMYAYDLFAALPCCAHRLRCKNCSRAIMDPSCGFNFFSEYSKPIQCPHCRAEDYHVIKPLEEIFQYKGPLHN